MQHAQQEFLLPLDEIGPAEKRSPATVAADTECEIAFTLYNELAGRCGLPRADDLTETRKAAMIKRLKGRGLDGWRYALETIERSAFLRGSGERGWKAHLDFILEPKKYQRLLERTYDQDFAPRDERMPVAGKASLDRYRLASSAEKALQMALFNGSCCVQVTERQVMWYRHQKALKDAGAKHRWTMRPPDGWLPKAPPAPPPPDPDLDDSPI